MFRFLRWFWRKAQAYAAQDIIVYIQKNAQFQHVDRDPTMPAKMPGRIVYTQHLEDFIVKRYIMPSRQDDFPLVEQHIKLNLDTLDNGIQTKPRPAGRQRPQGRTDSEG